MDRFFSESPPMGQLKARNGRCSRGGPQASSDKRQVSSVGIVLHDNGKLGDMTPAAVRADTPAMPINRLDFLNPAAAQPGLSFKERFATAANKFALDSWLSDSELDRLREAAFYACLCNISFNGLGGCGGKIRPCREQHRMNLEQTFMARCSEFWGSTGALAIPEELKK